MFRVVAHRRRSKEGKVPILDEAAGQNKTRATIRAEDFVTLATSQ